MRCALTAALVAATLLIPAAPSYACTRMLHDNSDYDVPTRDIDIARLKVTYDGKGVRATITMKDLRKKKRLRIFVGMVTRVSDEDPNSPEVGHLIELRLNEHRKQKVVNWVANPVNTDYAVERCRGVEVK